MKEYASGGKTPDKQFFVFSHDQQERRLNVLLGDEKLDLVVFGEIWL